MPLTLTETQTFDDIGGITIPQDGDAENAASVSGATTGFEPLADRTQFLLSAIPWAAQGGSPAAITQWVGNRPTLMCDGTNVIVGPTNALILNGLYLTGSSSTTNVSHGTLGGGSWNFVYALPPSTTIAVGSNGQALPQGTINVGSTTNFPTSGTVWIVTSTGVWAIAYTGKTSTTFTGCTGGKGTLTTGNAVTGTTIIYTTNTTAPEASLTYQFGSFSLRYVGCFRADSAGFPMAFRAENGRYVYTSGGDSSNTPNSVLNALGATPAVVATQLQTYPSSNGNSISLIPPTSRKGLFYAQLEVSGSGNSCNLQFDWSTPAIQANSFAINVNGQITGHTDNANVWFEMFTNTDQSIAYQASANTNTLMNLFVEGFVEQWSA